MRKFGTLSDMGSGDFFLSDLISIWKFQKPAGRGAGGKSVLIINKGRVKKNSGIFH